MSRPRKILIAASAGLREGLVEQLSLWPEFELVGSGSPEDASKLLRENAPDLAILDADCGASLARSVRAAGFDGPVLLLCEEAGYARPETPGGRTARLMRPFRFADLLARIRAELRSREAARDDCLSFGPYRFRASSGELVHTAGTRLRLTEKEGAILKRLALAGGEAVPKDMLLRDVWGYNPTVTTRTLETHVYRLRRKIEAGSAEGRLLVTEKKGYRLVSRAIGR